MPGRKTDTSINSETPWEELPERLSLLQAARFLGVDLNFVKVLVARGDLPTERVLVPNKVGDSLMKPRTFVRREDVSEAAQHRLAVLRHVRNDLRDQGSRGRWPFRKDVP